MDFIKSDNSAYVILFISSLIAKFSGYFLADSSIISGICLSSTIKSVPI